MSDMSHNTAAYKKGPCVAGLQCTRNKQELRHRCADPRCPNAPNDKNFLHQACASIPDESSDDWFCPRPYPCGGKLPQQLPPGPGVLEEVGISPKGRNGGSKATASLTKTTTRKKAVPNKKSKTAEATSVEVKTTPEPVPATDHSKEKELVKFLSEKDDKFARKNLTTEMWKTVFLLDVPTMKALGNDPEVMSRIASLNGIQKILARIPNLEREPKAMCVCRECFFNTKVALTDALIKVSGTNVSNVTSHVKTTHRTEADRVAKAIAAADKSSEVDAKCPPKNALTNTVVVTNRKTTYKDVQKKLHNAIYVCINDTGLPKSLVERPEFRTMIQVASQSGELKPDDCNLGRDLYKTIENEHTDEIVNSIRALLSGVSGFYSTLYTKQNFVYVCHDIWDAKKKDKLGVCLIFADPRTGVYYKIPVGLLDSESKTAKVVAEQVLELLKVFGIDQSYLRKSVNDNTSSAVAAGKFIIGLGDENVGYCKMHTVDLVVKHACGQIQRSKSKIVCDEFPECEAIRLKTRAFVACLMSKKCKARFRGYSQFHGGDVTEIPLPNSTRVAGTYLMYEVMLRSRYALDKYLHSRPCPPELKLRMLTDHEWELLAQITAVLLPTRILSMELQTDRVGAIAVSLLQIRNCRSRLNKCVQDGFYEVVDTGLKNGGWPATKPFSQLERVLRHKRTPSLMSSADSIFLEPVTEKFSERMEGEFVRYFGAKVDIDEDRDIAMMSHPFVAGIGLDVLEAEGVYNAADIVALKSNLEQVVFARTWNENSTVSKTASMLVQENSWQQEEDVDDSDDEDDIFQRLTKKRRLENAAASSSGNGNGMGESAEQLRAAILLKQAELRDQIAAEIKQWFEYCRSETLNFGECIQQYPMVEGTTAVKVPNAKEDATLKKHARHKNVLRVWMHFDVLKWWVGIGRVKFPLLFPVAVIFLSMPYTNAFQERTFSTAQWLDHHLRQKQTSESLQKRVLGKLNRKAVREFIEINATFQVAEKQVKVRTPYVGIGKTLKAIAEAGRLQEEEAVVDEAGQLIAQDSVVNIETLDRDEDEDDEDDEHDDISCSSGE